MHASPDNIHSWLNQRDIFVPVEWVQACLGWLSEEHAGKTFSASEWQKMVMEQWYFADLRELSFQIISDELLNSDKYNYTGSRLMLQVMWAKNVGEAYYGQLRKLEGTTNTNALVSADDDQVDLSSFRSVSQSTAGANTNSKAKDSSRMILMELTDGVKCIKAMECKPIPELTLGKLVPGLKVCIRGPLLCRRGVLMLKSSNIEIIAGELEELSEENNLGNILRQSLATNIGLNVNSTNNLPNWYTSRTGNANARNLDGSSSNSSQPATVRAADASLSSRVADSSIVTQNIRNMSATSAASTLPIRQDSHLPSSATSGRVNHATRGEGNMEWSSDDDFASTAAAPFRNTVHSTPVRGIKRPATVDCPAPSRASPLPIILSDDILNEFDDDEDFFSQVASEIDINPHLELLQRESSRETYPSQFAPSPRNNFSRESSNNQGAANCSRDREFTRETYPNQSAPLREINPGQCAPNPSRNVSRETKETYPNQSGPSSGASVSDDFPFCYIFEVGKRIFSPNFKEENWLIRGFVSAVISVLEISKPDAFTYEWLFKVRICDGSGFLDCQLSDSLLTEWMKISAHEADQIREIPTGPAILEKHLNELKARLSGMTGIFTVNIAHCRQPKIINFVTIDRSTLNELADRFRHNYPSHYSV